MPTANVQSIAADIDWGSVPAYFGGIALAFTAATIWRDRSKAQQDQAQHVAAWIVGVKDGARLIVRNASDLPVFSVSAHGVLGGSVDIAGTPISGSEAQVGPQSTISVAYEVGEFLIDQAPRMRFTDAAGRRWERSSRGELKRYRGSA